MGHALREALGLKFRSSTSELIRSKLTDPTEEISELAYRATNPEMKSRSPYMYKPGIWCAP